MKFWRKNPDDEYLSDIERLPLSVCEIVGPDVEKHGMPDYTNIPFLPPMKRSTWERYTQAVGEILDEQVAYKKANPPLSYEDEIGPFQPNEPACKTRSLSLEQFIAEDKNKSFLGRLSLKFLGR